MRQIAGIAGCALRSVYERINDMHTLRLAAVDHALCEPRNNLDLQLDALDKRSRLRAIVRFQAEEYEHWAPLWCVLVPFEHHSAVKSRLNRIRHNRLEERINELYRQELTPTDEAQQEKWLQLLGAVTSLENWRYLRYSRRLPFEDICEQWGWFVDRITMAAIPDMHLAAQ